MNSCLEEGKELGDGRTEGPPAIGDGEPAAVSLMPDVDGMHIYVFESLRLDGS